MRRLIVGLIALAVGCSGCALFQKPADTVSFQRGKFFAVAYRAAKVHGQLIALVGTRCAAKALDKAFCDFAKQANAEWERNVEKPLLKNLANPEYVTDWDAIGEAVEIIGGLAGAASGNPAALGGALGGVGGLLGK